MFWPQSVFLCVVWISEQTTIISLHSINPMAFLTKPERVYCEVQTKSANVIQVNIGL
jgi:hypothetical protein